MFTVALFYQIPEYDQRLSEGRLFLLHPLKLIMAEPEFRSSDTKAGTIGGVLLALLLRISGNELLQTALFSAVGAFGQLQRVSWPAMAANKAQTRTQEAFGPLFNVVLYPRSICLKLCDGYIQHTPSLIHSKRGKCGEESSVHGRCFGTCGCKRWPLFQKGIYPILRDPCVY
jgi:hypothetical protein